MGVYATAAGIKPLLSINQGSKLGLTDTAFDAALETLITWAEARINGYMGTSYTPDDLAADLILAGALQSVTYQAVDNFLIHAQQRKTAPIVTVQGMNVQTPNQIIMTEDMKRDLKPYKIGYRPAPVFAEGAKRFTHDATGLITEPEDGTNDS